MGGGGVAPTGEASDGDDVIAGKARTEFRQTGAMGPDGHGHDAPFAGVRAWRSHRAGSRVSPQAFRRAHESADLLRFGALYLSISVDRGRIEHEQGADRVEHRAGRWLSG